MPREHEPAPAVEALLRRPPVENLVTTIVDAAAKLPRPRGSPPMSSPPPGVDRMRDLVPLAVTLADLAGGYAPRSRWTDELASRARRGTRLGDRGDNDLMLPGEGDDTCDL